MTRSPPGTEEELKADRMPMDAMLSRSNFVSVNLPFLPGTHHCIHAGMLNLMKPTTILINMARGPVRMEDDMVSALREQRIAGAGSDVDEVEPPAADHLLFVMENFVGTLYMSAHEEGMIRMNMVARMSWPCWREGSRSFRFQVADKETSCPR